MSFGADFEDVPCTNDGPRKCNIAQDGVNYRTVERAYQACALADGIEKGVDLNRKQISTHFSAIGGHCSLSSPKIIDQ
jgi:hypothetical protein